MNNVSAPTRCPSFEMILEMVGNEFGVTKLELRSDRRTRPLARARQVAMYVAMKMTTFSTVKVGTLLGKRDHTTVIHGVRRIKELLDLDLEFADRVHLVMDALTQAVEDAPPYVETAAPVVVVPRFYVGWTTSDGQRRYGRSLYSEEVARTLVDRFNNTLPITGQHAAIPKHQIERWVAGS